MGLRICALVLLEPFLLDAVRLKAVVVSLGHLLHLVASGVAGERHP
ncbi:hypothetical protein RIN61_22550 [Pseudomonas inefficax]|mgnify:CR=1 FL=1|jgi:hypothetical protein|nr:MULTISPECIES: hypothetical protein [Pseudomonas]MBT9238583.1 hypothetical protein [Pseudomonas sp. MG-2]MCM8915395.1 hypothetical protein [Pseudomonas inefficax]WNN38943.1 hypothetical protein RIN61_22550 [Pseudomonas inefficax]